MNKYAHSQLPQERESGVHEEYVPERFVNLLRDSWVESTTLLIQCSKNGLITHWIHSGRLIEPSKGAPPVNKANRISTLDTKETVYSYYGSAMLDKRKGQRQHSYHTEAYEDAVRSDTFQEPSQHVSKSSIPLVL